MPSLPYCLYIASGRKIGFISLSRALTQCEIRVASSRIWIRVTVSISNNDNRYTSNASRKLCFALKWFDKFYFLTYIMSLLYSRTVLSYAPPAYECNTRLFLRSVRSQGRSTTQGTTRQAVPKMPRAPSAFFFSGRLRRQVIRPTPPKRVKAWRDAPLRPEVYPVVENTRTNHAACTHGRSRAPHQLDTEHH